MTEKPDLTEDGASAIEAAKADLERMSKGEITPNDWIEMHGRFLITVAEKFFVAADAFALTMGEKLAATMALKTANEIIAAGEDFSVGATKLVETFQKETGWAPGKRVKPTPSRWVKSTIAMLELKMLAVTFKAKLGVSLMKLRNAKLPDPQSAAPTPASPESPEN